jgi:hypothetical protein
LKFGQTGMRAVRDAGAGIEPAWLYSPGACAFAAAGPATYSQTSKSERAARLQRELLHSAMELARLAQLRASTR